MVKKCTYGATALVPPFTILLVQCFNTISESSSEMHESNPCGLDSSTGRAADRYSEGASSNPVRVNTFQLTSAVSDYHEIISLHVPPRMIIKTVLYSFIHKKPHLTAYQVVFSRAHTKTIKLDPMK